MNASIKKNLAGAFVALVLSVSGASATDYEVGDLAILHPWARATAPGAPVGGGYMVIVNHGLLADRLMGGSADFADKVEIHEMKMNGDTMVMRPVEGGLEIPPEATVELKPGGYHVMFMGLKGQFKKDETLPVTLHFERAGDVAVEFTVGDMSTDVPMKNMMGN